MVDEKLLLWSLSYHHEDFYYNILLLNNYTQLHAKKYKSWVKLRAQNLISSLY